MQKYDYIITGMGASGLMLGYQMVMDPYFKQKKILILDKNVKDQNDRTWSFWENGEGIWDKILYKKWKNIYFGSHRYTNKINIDPYCYKTIRSKDFYEFTLQRIKESGNIEITYESLQKIDDEGTIVEVETDQRKYLADKVFNSVPLVMPHLDQKLYPVLNQHFLGWFVKAKKPSFDENTATFMDFEIAQNGNTRFMYVLPISGNEALIEYTLFSEALLQDQEYEDEIEKYLHQKGIDEYEIVEKEKGCIPMTSYEFRNHNSKNILHIGTMGGWTKASTGFTFSNSQKKIEKLLRFLKTKKDLSKFDKRTRFWYYDLLFLDVLYQNNHLGGELFSKLFKRNKSQQILKFLDEETTGIEDIRITTSLPWGVFLKVLWKRLVK